MQTRRAQWNDLLGRIEVPELSVPGRAPGGPRLSLLPHVSAIAVTGPDAERFLQNQLTNDLALVDERRGQLSGACTPKGRLLSVAHVSGWDEGYLLRVPNSNAPRLIEHLTKYRLRSRVDIAELDLVAIGVSSREVPWALDDVHDVARFSGGVAHRVAAPADETRTEIVGTADAVAALWPRFVDGAALTGPEGWVSLDVRAGLPTIVPATEDAFVPQMVNLDRIGGVSFTKGCYPGQEIVARLEYRGTVKRRMGRAWVGSSDRPVPGTDLSADERVGAGSALGKVVVSAPADGGGHDLLVSAQVSVLGGDVTIGGERLDWRDLPYSIGDDELPPSP